MSITDIAPTPNVKNPCPTDIGSSTVEVEYGEGESHPPRVVINAKTHSVFLIGLKGKEVSSYTRLQVNSKLKILKTLRICPGRSLNRVGKSSKDIFSFLSRQVVDVALDVSFLQC